MSTQTKIERYVDAFCLRYIVKNEQLYFFVLRCLKEYYSDMAQFFKSLANHEEDQYPYIIDIEHCISHVL